MDTLLPRKSIISDVPQGSNLGLILFLISITDLPNGIKSICKICTDGISLFPKVKNKNRSAVELNYDLKILSNCTTQWKMSANNDPNKQTVEILFWKRRQKKMPTTNFKWW